MIDKETVRETLEGIGILGTKRTIGQLNLIRDIIITDEDVKIYLANTGLAPMVEEVTKNTVQKTIEELDGAGKVTVEYTDVKAQELNEITKIIAVMSGKGGVGKSLVSSLVAIALKRAGYDVGILDADITGPSIPKMFGVNISPTGNESGIMPVMSKTGIGMMSINLILPDEGEAVIWRGPLIANAIKQFGNDVLWGKLDYLIIDLPPGTADAPLTVMQSFPITGVIVVYTPQDLVDMIVRKALSMAEKMDKKVLGVVENMSYFYVPEIDKKIEIFGKSRGDQMAKAANAPLLAQIPIDPELAKLCDAGSIEDYEGEVLTKLSKELLKALK
ncbi:MAG: Mrp/NBP35 family ATP-binding protein [Dehalococcoidales bacterium]|nr:Mrp/NBP35 family ATP-binding protein [Dehalococcoidales bacterium]